jgi:hypothetical protein
MSVTALLTMRAEIRNMLVVPAEAGIQHLKSLDSGQKHAGMTLARILVALGKFFLPRDMRQSRVSETAMTQS